MAMNLKISSMSVPADTVRKCSGIAMDIGGSAIKFVYRKKSDWEELKANQDAKTGVLTFLTCGRPDLDAALDKIKDEVYISQEEGKKTKAYSCGVGGYQWHEKLQETLQIEIENVVEGDCQLEGLFFFLKHIPQKVLVYPSLTEDIEAITTEMKKTTDIWKQFIDLHKHQVIDVTGTVSLPSPVTLSRDKSMTEQLGEDLYPAVMIQLGSAFVTFKLKADGEALFCNSSPNGGRHFLGMASMLTGCKTYDEFIDLAERGNQVNVSESMGSFMKKDDDDNDPYAINKDIDDDQIVFSFGQTVFKDRDDFKKEDLAKAWLLALVVDIVQTAHSQCIKQGAKHIIVCGSMANRPIVRKLITRELTRHSCLMLLSDGKQLSPKLYFLQNGGHIGAFGALLNSVNKFTKDRKANDAAEES